MGDLRNLLLIVVGTTAIVIIGLISERTKLGFILGGAFLLITASGEIIKALQRKGHIPRWSPRQPYLSEVRKHRQARKQRDTDQ